MKKISFIFIALLASVASWAQETRPGFEGSFASTYHGITDPLLATIKYLIK